MNDNKRAAELEELRKKQLAKSGQQNLGQAAAQPTQTMELWLMQQKAMTEKTRQQQMEATNNLRSYRNVADANISTTTNQKEEIRKKEMEAKSMLHSYRSSTDIISTNMSTKEELKRKEEEAKNLLHSYRGAVNTTGNSFNHKKRESVGGGSNNNMAALAQVEVPNRVDVQHAKSLFEQKQQTSENNNTSQTIAPSKNKIQAAHAPSSTSKSVFDQQKHHNSDPSFGSSNSSNGDNYEVVTNNNSDDSPGYVHNSNQLNEDIADDQRKLSDSSDWIVVKEQKQKEQEVCTNNNDEIYKPSSSSSSIKTDVERKSVHADTFTPTQDEWVTTYICVAFGLLTDIDMTPKVGVYKKSGENNVVDELMLKMENVTINSLKNSNISESVIHLPDDKTMAILIEKDVAYQSPTSRPNVSRSVVKAKIPISYNKAILEDVSDIKRLICGALRKCVEDGF